MGLVTSCSTSSGARPGTLGLDDDHRRRELGKDVEPCADSGTNAAGQHNHSEHHDDGAVPQRPGDERLQHSVIIHIAAKLFRQEGLGVPGDDSIVGVVQPLVET